jgi:hypothetical protein
MPIVNGDTSIEGELAALYTLQAAVGARAEGFDVRSA